MELQKILHSMLMNVEQIHSTTKMVRLSLLLMARINVKLELDYRALFSCHLKLAYPLINFTMMTEKHHSYPIFVPSSKLTQIE